MELLISHASEDERSAHLLQQLIERCSLKQIRVWYSTDRAGEGGVRLGSSWFPHLMQRLSETDMIIALLTPRSINDPWLYFECGNIALKGHTAIIPLTLGLPVSSIPMPLSAYQGHDLSGPGELSNFLAKLFDVAGITYDSELTAVVREDIAGKLMQIAASIRQDSSRSISGRNSLVDDMRNHIDKRFLEVHSLLSLVTASRSSHPESEPSKRASDYNRPMPAILTFEVRKNEKILIQFDLQLFPDDTVQAILDRCYYTMNHNKLRVRAYHYLTQWAIYDKITDIVFSSEGRGDQRPASHHFDPTRDYLIEILDSPNDLPGAALLD